MTNNLLLGVEIPLEQVPQSHFTMDYDFQNIRRQIRPLFPILGRFPTTDLETVLAAKPGPGTNTEIRVDEKILEQAKNLLDEFKSLLDKQKRETQVLWQEVNQLWLELDENEDIELGFTNAHTETFETLKSLKLKMVQLNTEKQARIESFIVELRAQLIEIWTHCLISDEEKSKFQEFTSKDFTEELLNIHKEELMKWKVYQEKNQEVLDKVKRREVMWEKLKELEAKSDDPTRFVNRGGTLLKDQKEFNTLMKTLPKLETELKRLAYQFEKEHGKKVTILGQEIPQMIDENWENFREEKTKKKNYVKPKARQSLMPSRPVTEKRPAPASSRTPMLKRICLDINQIDTS